MERSAKYEPEKYRRQHFIVFAASAFLALSGLSVVTSSPAQAAGASLYAFAGGQAISPASCPG